MSDAEVPACGHRGRACEEACERGHWAKGLPSLCIPDPDVLPMGHVSTLMLRRVPRNYTAEVALGVGGQQMGRGSPSNC